MNFGYPSLRNMGIDVLTGERCAVGMRLLCDLTKKAKELIEEFLGARLQCDEAWNTLGSYSMMLSYETLREIWIFYQLVKCRRVVMETNVGCDAVSLEDWEAEYKPMDPETVRAMGITRVRMPLREREGVSRPDGINIHQMSGR